MGKYDPEIWLRYNGQKGQAFVKLISWDGASPKVEHPMYGLMEVPPDRLTRVAEQKFAEAREQFRAMEAKRLEADEQKQKEQELKLETKRRRLFHARLQREGKDFSEAKFQEVLRTFKTTHCFGCKSELNSVTNSTCPQCDGLRCLRCERCLCSYNSKFS